MLLGPRALHCFLALATIKFSLGLIPVRAVGPPLDFAKSKWIWTAETVGGVAPTGSRALRKIFVAPEGKKPASADILIASDDDTIFYVNGAVAGSTTYAVPKQFCVPLRSCLNVFAVNATNAPGPAGIVATIRVTYTDGTTSTIVTDATWRTTTSLPAGFEKLTFDDSSWDAATPLLPLVPNISIPPNPPALSFSSSSRIWTKEAVGGIAPAGACAFRKTFVVPPGQLATSADILIVADDQYSLYVNGRFIGTGNAYNSAQRFTIDLQRGSDVLFAVYAVNGGTAPNPAGLLVTIQVTTVFDCYCTTVSQIVSDGTWKLITGAPAGFHLPGFDDSKWLGATAQAANGAASVTLPTGVSPPGSPLPGAPVGK